MAANPNHDPDLLAGLKEAARLGQLIPFVGAGASKVAGCPSWTEFADSSLRFFVDQGRFTHAQLDQIKTLHPRVKLSLARSMEREHKLKIDFKKVLYPKEGLVNSNGQRLYRALSKLGRTFVTTNYDEWLDSSHPAPEAQIACGQPEEDFAARPTPNVIYKVRDLAPDCLSVPNTVIHLHGSLRETDDLIVTTQDYIRHYANDRHGEENYVLTFLHALFQKRKTVLFIGYGLEELEILEYVIGKADLRQVNDENKQIRHYILQGFFSHEQEIRRTLERYYLENGIQMIPFSRDERDWDQLIEEVEKLADLMPAAEILKTEKLVEMKGMLDG
ncbi:conserved hypothetical protein [Rhodospirillaceae bacterium LM-1]|nr:conserved hypothetical protein [Rhodospirillaceae bacterium LM-1]